MDKYDEYLNNLSKTKENAFVMFQVNIYSNIGGYHDDLANMMPISHKNFYKMLESMKRAARNIETILHREEDIYNLSKGTIRNDELLDNMHDAAADQTRYFTYNMNSILNNLHLFLKNKFNTEVKNQPIYKTLKEDEKTKHIGDLLYQSFHDTMGPKNIIRLRNTLLTDKPWYEVVRYIVDDKSISTLAIKLYDEDYFKSLGSVIIKPSTELVALPSTNHKIPTLKVMHTKSSNILYEELDGTEQSTKTLYDLISSEIIATTPTFQLAPTVVDLYKYTVERSQEIILESLKIKEKTNP